MIVRQRASHVNDYRIALNGTGDVSVGAYARAQRRKGIFIGLAGLALIGGAVVTQVLLRPREGRELSGMVPIAVRCVAENCGYEGVIVVKRGASDSELVCPKCGQHSCRKVWQCRNCGARFVPQRGSGEVSCPNCGSQQVGAAYVAPPEGGGR